MHTSIEKINTQIFQDFLPHIRIIKCIGQGAFSQVFLIYDQKQKIYLAVKKIPLFGLCEYERKLVLNQAKILSSIMHPNIIRFHQCLYDNHEENVYIFMEYAKEGDLLNMMYRVRLEKEQIKQNVIWKIISDVSHALNYLHSNGIIHRDIKPANILKQDENFKLADMNVSKIKEDGVMTRTNVGTPLYTSPQVAKNQYYNQKCDIWSLGVVVYELCCFKNPFNMTNLNKMKKDPQKVATSAIDKIPLRYSRGLSDIIKKMLIKDPKQRISIKQILQICKKQGMTINYLSHQNIGQFKTIVFPTTGQRWVNLVHEKKKRQKLDLTIDDILKEQEIRKQEENSEKEENICDFSTQLIQFNKSGNNQEIMRKNHKTIFDKVYKKNNQNNLKNIDNEKQSQQNIQLVQQEYFISTIKNKNQILRHVDQNIAKINNFLLKQSESKKNYQRRKIFESQNNHRMLNQKDFSQNKSNQNVSKDKMPKFHRDSSKSKPKNQFIHSRQKSQGEFGIKFIKLSKNLDKLHS